LTKIYKTPVKKGHRNIIYFYARNLSDKIFITVKKKFNDHIFQDMK
jgi:hypothetical protein